MSLLSVTDICALPDDTPLIDLSGVESTVKTVLGLRRRDMWERKTGVVTRWRLSRKEAAFR